jgi:hypothetical protein
MNQYSAAVKSQNESDPLEFEIRFGKNHYDHETKTSRFESNVEIQFFYDLKKELITQNFVQTEKVCTIASVYSNGIRKEVECDENFDEKSPQKKVYVKKTKIKKYDVYDFDMRLSLSKETPLMEEDPQVLQAIGEEPQMIRYKTRTSFMLPLGRIDLTIVKTGQDTAQTYEVEVEVSNPNDEYLISLLTVMLQIRQSNYYVIPNSEKRKVLYEYRNMVGSNYFIGAQPETLQRNALNKMSKEQYAVTDKADGQRMLMFVNSKGAIYLIDDNLGKVLFTKCFAKSHPGSLIDGEYIMVGTTMQFLAFDTIVFNSKDLRGNSQYDLRHRLYLATTLIQSIEETQY